MPEPPADPVQVLALNLPSDWIADSAGHWKPGVTGVVATVSVLFWNTSPVMAHPGCTVLSDAGGLGDGHTYVSGTDAMVTSPTTLSLTFQSSTQPGQGPPSQIYLVCNDSSDHPPLPPEGSMDVRVLTAEMSVIPRSF